MKQSFQTISHKETFNEDNKTNLTVLNRIISTAADYSEAHHTYKTLPFSPGFDVNRFVDSIRWAVDASATVTGDLLQRAKFWVCWQTHRRVTIKAEQDQLQLSKLSWVSFTRFQYVSKNETGLEDEQKGRGGIKRVRESRRWVNKKQVGAEIIGEIIKLNQPLMNFNEDHPESACKCLSQ